MIANIGSTDRIIRIVLGLLLVVWFFFDQGGGTWHWAKIVVGLILLGTAAINFCPLYRIFGMSTHPKS